MSPSNIDAVSEKTLSFATVNTPLPEKGFFYFFFAKKSSGGEKQKIRKILFCFAM